MSGFGTVPPETLGKPWWVGTSSGYRATAILRMKPGVDDETEWVLIAKDGRSGFYSEWPEGWTVLSELGFVGVAGLGRPHRKLGSTLSEVSVMLREFHQAFGVEGDRDTPGVPTDEIRDLRWNLLREEVEEYHEAAAFGDVVEVADALADMVYIIYGTARTYGIPLDRVLAEVHRSNMAKLVDGKVLRRADGKVLKPEGWVAPDIAGVLAPYVWEAEG